MHFRFQVWWSFMEFAATWIHALALDGRYMYPLSFDVTTDQGLLYTLKSWVAALKH